MGIKTVRDYLGSNGKKGIEYCFKSSAPVTDYGTTIYSIVEKPSEGDKYLHIRPLNGHNFPKVIVDRDSTETVHVLLKQHLDDVISNISPQ